MIAAKNKIKSLILNLPLALSLTIDDTDLCKAFMKKPFEEKVSTQGSGIKILFFKLGLNAFIGEIRQELTLFLSNSSQTLLRSFLSPRRKILCSE